jgi:hypothetical protein
MNGLKRSLCVKNAAKSEKFRVTLGLSDREKDLLRAGGKLAAVKTKYAEN